MSDTFQRIAPEQARQLRENGAQVVDIRDPQSFAVGHISGSRHIDNHSVADFIAAADLDAPLVVVCYHGNSSQSAAAYFIQQGFSDVYSLDGGFELWRSVYPADTSSGEAGVGRAATPPKTVTSLAFLPLLRPERTILFLRPSKTGESRHTGFRAIGCDR